MDSRNWSTDVPISQPVPPSKPVLVSMAGFGFTADGLTHDLTEAEAEAIFTPTFQPPREDEE